MLVSFSLFVSSVLLFFLLPLLHPFCWTTVNLTEGAWLSYDGESATVPEALSGVSSGPLSTPPSVLKIILQGPRPGVLAVPGRFWAFLG